jgi:diguanylate cyclase (GGDEF)-like protein
MADQSRSEDPTAWYRPLFEGNVLSLLICDATTQEILEANDAALACLGRGRPALAGARLPDLYDVAEAGAGMASGSARRISLPDGSARHVLEQHCAPCVAGHPARPARLIVLQDVSVYAQTEARARLGMDELQRAHALARIGTWVWDAATDTYHTETPRGYRVLGPRNGEPLLSLGDVVALIHPDDREAVKRSRERALRDQAYNHDVEFRIIRPDGVLRWLRATAEVQRDAAGQPLRMFGLVQDVSDRRMPDDRVRRLAYYDSVTGLPNRNLFEQSCTDRLARLRDGGTLACMIVDLVRFRDVNYALTHSSGDVLLGLVAERLSALVGPAGLVAHVDARFPILLPDVDENGARRWAHAIHRAFEAPFAVAGISYELGARIGIALAPSHGGDDHTLLRKADVALYQATSAGRNVAVYASGHDPHTPGRLALIGDFRAAIESRQIRLFCQPKVDLKRGEIVGVEALVRWVHPDKGIIGPEVFMPLIESTELVHVLTRHMLASAVTQCEEWRSQGVHLPIAVNLSARDLAALTLSDHLEALMDAHQSCNGMIGLEVTESSLMQDPDASIAELERLSGMGFRLYVDDFGTGYSSLSYLSRLPVDVIKIDHGFTMKMIKDRRAAAIVKSTIHLAHDLGMTVVAEGVSERAIWDALCVLGCDEAQGYYIAPPLPAAEVLAWARQSPYALLAAATEPQAALV